MKKYKDFREYIWVVYLVWSRKCHLVLNLVLAAFVFSLWGVTSTVHPVGTGIVHFYHAHLECLAIWCWIWQQYI